MRDIDSEIELQEADHVQVLRELDRTEFLRRRRPSLVSFAPSLSLASLSQLLVWVVVLSLSSDLTFPDAWSVACAVFFFVRGSTFRVHLVGSIADSSFTLVALEDSERLWNFVVDM